MDIVLTGRGRELFALGELNFSHYALFDDGIDYDPWSTGSLTDEERDDLIHSSPTLEAPCVPDRRASIIPLEPNAFVFKAAPDYGAVPRMLNPNPTGSLAVLRCDQFSSGSTFIRTGTNIATVKLEISAEAGGAEGFSIHFYASGTHGLNEIRTRTDLGGRRALDPFIAVAIDDEAPQDRPDQSKPNSTRKGGRK